MTVALFSLVRSFVLFISARARVNCRESKLVKGIPSVSTLDFRQILRDSFLLEQIEPMSVNFLFWNFLAFHHFLKTALLIDKRAEHVLVILDLEGSRQFFFDV